MDWISIFLLIFALIVLIIAVANAIYFWRAYSLPAVGISTGTSLTLLIVNVVVGVMALAGLIWALYILFTSGDNTVEVERDEDATIISDKETGKTTVITNKAIKMGTPSATAYITRV